MIEGKKRKIKEMSPNKGDIREKDFKGSSYNGRRLIETQM